MPKEKISARELLVDIRAGATDEFLMKKYGVFEKGLQSLFQKLVSAKAITQAELDRRASATEEVEAVIIEEEEDEAIIKGYSQHFIIEENEIENEARPVPPTSTQTVFTCPACKMPQNNAFEVCPECGVTVSKFRRTPPLTEDMKEQVAKSFPTRYDSVWNRPLNSKWVFGVCLAICILSFSVLWLIASLSPKRPSVPPSGQGDLKVKDQSESSERKAISELYAELLSFKDDPEFLTNGFQVGNKYHDWLTRAKARLDERASWANLRVDDMIRLGDLFFASKGKIDYQASWVMRNIETYIKGPEPARTTAPRDSSDASSDWKYCYDIAYRFGRCAIQRSYGLSPDCPDGFKIPNECRDLAVTFRGINDASSSVSR